MRFDKPFEFRLIRIPWPIPTLKLLIPKTSHRLGEDRSRTCTSTEYTTFYLESTTAAKHSQRDDSYESHFDLPVSESAFHLGLPTPKETDILKGSNDPDVLC
jgi:hypothetical protein